HGDLELYFVGNDVVLRAAVDRAHGDDGWVRRHDLPADDRLQVEHDPCGDDDGIDGRVRRGAVAALAFHDDVYAIHVGQRQALRERDVAVRVRPVAVQGQAIIGSRKSLEEAVGQHHASAGADLFGGLADDDQRAFPAVLHFGQYASHSYCTRHVHVV